MKILLALALAVSVVAMGSPPTLATLQKYVVYSYAAACREGLQDWSCFWCTLMPQSQVPPVKVCKKIPSTYR